MTKAAIITQQGALIKVTKEDMTPLPGDVAHRLGQALTYTHFQYHHGANAHDPTTGVRENITTESRRLYVLDNTGCFCCQHGFRHKVETHLATEGYACSFLNHTQVQNPGAYTPDWDRVFSRFKFRPKQDECLAQIDMHDSGIIDAVTAFGKTHIMGMICNLYPQAKIDIVTKRKDVVATIRQFLSQWIPNVGQVGGGKRRKSRVTVYTADSLHHSDFDAEFFLADEVHELMTDRYAEILSRYWYSRCFGFTATAATRFDNAHERMEGLFGPTIFYLPYQEAERLGLVVPILVQWIEVAGCSPCQGLRDLVAQKRKGIWQNGNRNSVIAATANSFVQQGQQTLILVDTLEHGLHLRQWLPHFKLCYSENALDPKKRQMYLEMGLMRPEENMSSPLRTKLRTDFENRKYLGAIATGVWSVGVSFDSLEVLVRAEGSSSETQNVQAPGRVCRIHEDTGKEVGIVVDFHDKFDSKFYSRSLDRRHSYHQHGWVQIQPNGKIWKPRRSRCGTERRP
jgi:superfamily II DNA or RNA helicase